MLSTFFLTNRDFDSTLRVRPAGIYTHICKSGPVRKGWLPLRCTFWSFLTVYVFTYACYSKKTKLLSRLYAHVQGGRVALTRAGADINIYLYLPATFSNNLSSISPRRGTPQPRHKIDPHSKLITSRTSHPHPRALHDLSHL